MTTALVGIAGTLGVLARYGMSRLTLHSDAVLLASVVGGVAAATAGYALGRKLP
jgi:hypothetical protein